MAAYAGVYVLTEAEIQSKEGAGVSGSVTSDMHTQWVLEAANRINVLCRHVFATDAAAFAALTTDVRYLLSEACSAWAAMNGIMYDTTGYDSRLEAESKVVLLFASWSESINLLITQGAVTFIKKGV